MKERISKMFISSQEEQELWMAIKDEFDLDWQVMSEKEKCAWYLEKEIFSEILIAGKIKKKNRVRVEYTDVGEILKKMRSSD